MVTLFILLHTGLRMNSSLLEGVRQRASGRARYHGGTRHASNAPVLAGHSALRPNMSDLSAKRGLRAPEGLFCSALAC